MKRRRQSKSLLALATTKPRARRVDHEHREQSLVFQWAALWEHEIPELKYLFSTLNGVRLSPGLAGKAKAAGMKRGVPDIFLDVPMAVAGRGAPGSYHGLRIELKALQSDGYAGKPTPEQVDWLKQLSGRGYCCRVCVGAEDAESVIRWYLGTTRFTKVRQEVGPRR